VLKTKLHQLPITINKEYEGKIDKFNNHVHDVINRLNERGEQSSDILHYLFTAYEEIQAKPFSHYIEKINQDHHYNGTLTTAKALMHNTDTFYCDKVASGKWEILMSEQADYCTAPKP
jgi:hypothetical protein